MPHIVSRVTEEGIWLQESHVDFVRQNVAVVMILDMPGCL